MIIIIRVKMPPNNEVKSPQCKFRFTLVAMFTKIYCLMESDFFCEQL